jgi:ferredoxin
MKSVTRMNKVPVPQIDISKCNGCGLCVGVCALGGLVMVERVVIYVGGDDCDWCGMCEAVCQMGAIGCPYDIVIDEAPPNVP